MANQNFSNFDFRVQILSSDYFVGYDPTTPKEIRTTVGDLFTIARLGNVGLNIGNSSGLYSFAANNSFSIGDFSSSVGVSNYAIGEFSFSTGVETRARGSASQSHGFKSEALHTLSYVWSDGNVGTATKGISSSRAGQFLVNGSGGICLSGAVGINTDSIANSLTVVGKISSSTLDTAGVINCGNDIICKTLYVSDEVNSTGNTLFINDRVSILNYNTSNSLTVGGNISAIKAEISTELNCKTLTVSGDTIIKNALSARQLALSQLFAEESLPVYGSKTLTGYFLTIQVGSSSLYIPLYGDS